MLFVYMFIHRAWKMYTRKKIYLKHRSKVKLVL